MGVLYDWSVTAAENTSVSGVNIAENCPAANLNNAIRQVMADIRNTFLGDVFVGGTTASGYQLKVTGNKPSNTLVALQNLEAVGYTGVHFINSDGSLRSHLGWANSSAATRPNSAYFGTTAGSGGTVHLTAEDVTALLIDPSQNVHVAGGAVTGSGRLRVSAVGTSPHYAISTFDTVNYVAAQFVREVSGSAQEKGTIAVTDIGTSYTTTSDREFKNDEGALSPDKAWAILGLIQIHEFTWKVNNAADIGVFAQELYEIYPGAVVRGGWFDQEGNPSNAVTVGAIRVPWSVDLSKLMPLVVVALQDIHTTQQGFDERLRALEA